MKNTRPRNRPPPSEAAVPSGDSAPFVPLGTCTRVLMNVDVRWRWKSTHGSARRTCLKVVMRTGLPLASTPSSLAQVSPLQQA